MKRKPGSRPHGQIRRSQVVTTFGPGSMLDLPDYSVLVGGLDFWSTEGLEEIDERRLSEKLADVVEVDELKLYAPPPDRDDPTAPQTGITVFEFPEWFVTEVIPTPDRPPHIRGRVLVHRNGLTKHRFIDADKKRRAVVPVRFVRGCRAGHIDDIDWYAFVHNGPTECRRQLWLEERGTSGDLTEVFVRCECKMERSMAQASIMQKQALGNCNGPRPWLGPFTKEPCGEPNRLLIRTASNAYFSQLMSVISLPERGEDVKAAVGSVLEFLEAAEGTGDVKHERKKARVKAALEGFSDDEVFAEIQARRGGATGPRKSVKEAELETLISSKEEIGEDKPDGNFFARSLPREAWDKPWMSSIGRVVLVHRLREVVAQAGFTRFEALAPDIDGELEMGVRRATLAREVTWLPAIENRGEGIFLQFSQSAIKDWLKREAVIARGRELEVGFDCWQAEHHASKRKFPGLPYLMLHSFAHLLITAVSLECGYPASSIRERIYAIPDVGYGVLLHTGSSDAEGTLGGLIQTGRHIHEHVHKALELGELCSNDPVCAQHEPDNPHEHRFLHGADSDLRELAGVLRSGRLTAPFSTLALQRVLSSHVSPSLIDDLQHLADTGLTTEQIAAAFDLVLLDRRRRPRMDESVTLVTSGPEAGIATNRDTAVVVRDLFATAEQTVLVAGYAVYQGNRVFQALADRMQDRPHLKVRLFLNIRRDGDTSSSNELVRRFADRFKRHQWPADRQLPEVFYFPQSIDPSAEKLATLHAKCVVVDRKSVFVSSANFTEAAHERNIEIGLLIRSTRLAEQLESHFDSLQAAGVLQPVFE